MSSSLTKPASPVSYPGVNTNAAQIPNPVANVVALTSSMQVVKQNLDSLCGFRNDVKARAVTFNDLINLGLVSATALASTGSTTVGATGTVTSITAGGGLDGGIITRSGTISLSAIADGTVLANTAGSSATPVSTTVSALIDHALGGTQGNILYRSGSSWTVLAPGTSGKFLQTQGAGANPQWASPSSTFVTKLFLSSGTVGNGADATEDTLQTYTMPANTLVNTGQTLRITASGRLAANADTKTIKLYFGSTLIENFNTTANSANHTWWMEATVTRSGASAQLITMTGGRAVNALGTANGAAAGNYQVGGGCNETETSSIVIKVTGQDSGSAANGVLCDLMLVEMVSP